MRGVAVCGWLVVLVCCGVLYARGAEKPPQAEAATARAWRTLTEGINAKKFPERIIALKALADLGPNPKGVRLVAKVLKYKDPDVRAQAEATLGEMKSRAAIPPLRLALDDAAPQVSFAAARSLWQLGDTAGRRVLLEVLQGEKSTKDGFLAGHVRGARRQLQDKKGLVAMGAEKSAGGFLPLPFSLGAGLIKGEFSPGTNLARADCANLLAKRPDKETMLAFKAALVDRDWAVRAAAATALGQMGRRETQPWLEFALRDNKPAVRDAAAVAILRMNARRSRSSTYADLH